MMDITETTRVLSQLASLLNEGEAADWAGLINTLKLKLPESPAETVARLRALFGGAGSLNDVILYRDGMPLQHENDQLDMLRSRLYALCKSA